MTFLPEDDSDFLVRKSIRFDLVEEAVPGGGIIRGIRLPGTSLPSGWHRKAGDSLVPVHDCELLILIPQGYSTTRLDSFYTHPIICRDNGSLPAQAAGTQELFGVTWQFWSRHLSETDWRPGADGLESYLQYVHAALREA